MAENDPDSRDPSDEAYHQMFDSKGNAVADDLASLEADLNRKYSQDFDALDKSDSGDSDDSRQAVESGEQAPDTIPYSPGQTGGSITGRLRNTLKKKGATFAIVGLLTGIGTIGSSVLLGPAALLATMEKVLTNHNSNDTRANIMMRRAYIGGLLNGKECTGKACVFTTMNSEQKAKWEKQGFAVEGKTTADGRFKPTSFTFPDGTKVTTGSAFDNHARNSLDARKAANLVMNPKASTFTDEKSKFRSKILSKLKLSISERMTGSKDKDKEKRAQAMDGDMNTRTGATVDTDGNTRLSKVKSIVTSNSRVKAAIEKGGKLTSIADIASFACTAYTVVKTSIAGIKLYYSQELIRFALPWMQLAAQQYTYGDIDPELMEYAMDRLTWYSSDKDNPSYNKSAFDSNGLRSALYGDFDKLTESAKHYTTWYMTKAVASSEIMRRIEGMAGGKKNLQNACAVARGVSFLGMAFCVTSPVSAAICAGGAATMAAFGDDVVKYASGKLVDDAVKVIADANLTSDLKGVPLGDAIAAGIGLLLLQKSMSSGMRLATSTAAVTSFISATDDDYYRYVDEIAMDDARKNPLDTSNSYSLASRFAVAINQYRGSSTGLFDNIVNLFAISSTATSSFLNPGASAIYSMPNELTRQASTVGESLSRCEDQDMKDIGLVCKLEGSAIPVISESVIKQADEQANSLGDMTLNAREYMLGNNPTKTKYINEDNSTIGSGDDTEYTMYKQYCTDREFPLGTSDFDYGELTLSSSSKLAWALGARCSGNKADGSPDSAEIQTMVDNFYIFYTQCEIQVTLAEGQDCASTQSLAATTNTGGQWQIPAAGQCGDGFDPTGSRIGRNHKGIDISAGSGTAIIAPTSIKIVFVGQSPDGTTGNQITATATDGSGYSFRFMHMLDRGSVQVGQEVSKGTQVGKVGSTGDSSGPHLHMDVFPPSVNPMSYSGQVDPVTTFNQHGVSVSCN